MNELQRVFEMSNGFFFDIHAIADLSDVYKAALCKLESLYGGPVLTEELKKMGLDRAFLPGVMSAVTIPASRRQNLLKPQHSALVDDISKLMVMYMGKAKIHDGTYSILSHARNLGRQTGIIGSGSLIEVVALKKELLNNGLTDHYNLRDSIESLVTIGDEELIKDLDVVFKEKNRVALFHSPVYISGTPGYHPLVGKGDATLIPIDYGGFSSIDDLWRKAR